MVEMQIYFDKCFENPIEIIDAPEMMNVEDAFKRIEELMRKYYLLGYVSYDFGRVYFEVFEEFKPYKPCKISKPFGIISKPLITKKEYISKIEKIKEYISEGVTYEVNFTYPNRILTNLEDFELFEKLLERQRTPYNMFFKNKYGTILSFSPELFFKLTGNRILTKPMKGTAPRGRDSEEDLKNFEFLRNDLKNRAENIMIVDLLRNDLGRIAKTGTVKVEKLFEIEKHPTVFQMTSEISAELCPEITLTDIFKSIFPCGSITGAPKISTMRVIDELENFNRGVYCGAIGFLSPEEVVFSVPIRILQHKNTCPQEQFTKKSSNFICNVGGAIVWDSTAEDEWEETLTKTAFLNTEFDLIETAKDNWDKHVLRMKGSAKALNFKWREEIERLTVPKDKILRVILHKNGEFEVEHKELLPRPKGDDGRYKVRFRGKIHSSDPFLYHKTTVRTHAPADVFDDIRTNERGEVTEGTFTNVAILKNGKFYTPPLACGLLNGILRQSLIEEGKLEEKILYKKDFETAEKIFCINSIRGVVEVDLCS